MRVKTHFHFRFCLFLTLMLVLGGCQIQHDLASLTKGPDERAAAASPASGMEDSDPLARHMWARRQVDPRNFDKTANYTMSVKQYERTHNADGVPIEPEMEEDLAMHVPVPGHRPESAPHIKWKTVKTDMTGTEVIQSREIRETVQGASPVRKAAHMASVAPAMAGRSVLDLRMGEHPGKTRLVMDLDGPSAFEHVTDNEKHLLLITLPGVGWSAAPQKVFNNHSLFQAYVAKPAPDGGTVLAIRLKRDVQVVFSTAYPPNEGRGHRIVIDVAPL